MLSEQTRLDHVAPLLFQSGTTSGWDDVKRAGGGGRWEGFLAFALTQGAKNDENQIRKYFYSSTEICIVCSHAHLVSNNARFFFPFLSFVYFSFDYFFSFFFLSCLPAARIALELVAYSYEPSQIKDLELRFREVSRAKICIFELS